MACASICATILLLVVSTDCGDVGSNQLRLAGVLPATFPSDVESLVDLTGRV
jgi:hypothetical protein